MNLLEVTIIQGLLGKIRILKQVVRIIMAGLPRKILTQGQVRLTHIQELMQLIRILGLLKKTHTQEQQR